MIPPAQKARVRKLVESLQADTLHSLSRFLYAFSDGSPVLSGSSRLTAG